MNKNGTRSTRSTAKLLKKAVVINPQTIATALAESPEQLNTAQKRLDLVRFEYEAYLTTLSIQALSTPLFPGKTPEDPQRAASNEKERDLAIQYVCQGDPGYRRLQAEFEAAQRDVTLCRDRQANARLIAQLLLSQMRVA